jgi:hypothetical protein
MRSVRRKPIGLNRAWRIYFRVHEARWVYIVVLRFLRLSSHEVELYTTS